MHGIPSALARDSRLNESTSLQAELTLTYGDRVRPAMAIVDFLHPRDVIKEPHNIGRPKALAGFHLFLMQFFDETDVTALMAPDLRYLRGIQCHPCQSG